MYYRWVRCADTASFLHDEGGRTSARLSGIHSFIHQIDSLINPLRVKEMISTEMMWKLPLLLAFSLEVMWGFPLFSAISIENMRFLTVGLGFGTGELRAGTVLLRDNEDIYVISIIYIIMRMNDR